MTFKRTLLVIIAMLILFSCNVINEKDNITADVFVLEPYGECVQPPMFYKVSSDTTLTYIYNYFSKTEYKDVAIEVTGMSILETDFYKSPEHLRKNNYWSTKRAPDGVTCIKAEKACLAEYTSLKHSCDRMLRLLRKKHYSTEREQFLLHTKSKGFATDKAYIKKVKKRAAIVLKKLEAKANRCATNNKTCRESKRI